MDLKQSFPSGLCRTSQKLWLVYFWYLRFLFYTKQGRKNRNVFVVGQGDPILEPTCLAAFLWFPSGLLCVLLLSSSESLKTVSGFVVLQAQSEAD